MKTLKILMVLPLLAIIACSEEPTDSLLITALKQANSMMTLPKWPFLRNSEDRQTFITPGANYQ